MKQQGIDIGDFSGVRTVVTGGAGFIGSHLVERLLASGAEVAIVDNFLHSDKAKHLEGHRGLTVYEGDVRDAELILQALQDKDMVFHFAALVGIEETQKAPFELLDVEIKGTLNVLSGAVNSGAKRVIFASSSEVYGDSPKAMSEEGPVSPKSTYAVGKLVGEELCKAFYQRYGLEYTCLRYFNVYGPRQDERFVISRFVKRVLSNEHTLIYGDGQQTRDFTYIDDAVDMTLLASVRPEARCQVINIGTGVKTTINELASLIGSALGNKSPTIEHIDFDSKRPRDIEAFTRVADITRAREWLQYEPKVSLPSGIAKYVDWCLGR
jgi:UDP-glucose 4-epimerase